MDRNALLSCMRTRVWAMSRERLPSTTSFFATEFFVPASIVSSLFLCLLVSAAPPKKPAIAPSMSFTILGDLRDCLGLVHVKTATLNWIPAQPRHRHHHEIQGCRYPDVH